MFKQVVLVLVLAANYLLFAENLIVRLKDGTTVSYNLQQVKSVFFTDINSSSIEDKIKLAEMQITLMKNYPNPFNPATTIEFDLSESGIAELFIYNQNGQMVEKLFTGDLNKGCHSFTWNANSKHSSGAYFYKLSVNGECRINKMILVK